MVAKLTRGLRVENTVCCRALGAGQDLKSFDVDNRYGLEALKRIMDDCTGQTGPIAGVEVRKILVRNVFIKPHSGAILLDAFMLWLSAVKHSHRRAQNIALRPFLVYMTVHEMYMIST